jgi:dUTP pyrophosphatase
VSAINAINVNIRKLHADAVIPRYATDGSAAFDLVAVEDVIIAPGETALVPIGLSFEIPVGYEMQIRPRSGITKNTKLRVGNAPATIDSDFRGEVNVIIDNIAQVHYNGKLVSDCFTTVDGGYFESEMERFALGSYKIYAGDRIAQALIQRIPHVEFTLVDALSEAERGSGGFGSTGVKLTKGGE